MFRAAVFTSIEEFEAGCNQMMTDGYSLHSWQLSYNASVYAVFIRIPVEKKTGEGIRSR
jgi:surface polysaccharide O-acyltransferase-like enzyme